MKDWRKKRMNSKKEISSELTKIIEAADAFLTASKELLRCGEILLDAVKGFQTALSGETKAQELMQEDKAEPEKKTYTKQQVRAVLSGKSAAGFGKEVKELLKKHGAAKLSELAESEYEAVVSEAEVIGNE